MLWCFYVYGIGSLFVLIVAPSKSFRTNKFIKKKVSLQSGFRTKPFLGFFFKFQWKQSHDNNLDLSVTRMLKKSGNFLAFTKKIIFVCRKWLFPISWEGFFYFQIFLKESRFLMQDLLFRQIPNLELKTDLLCLLPVNKTIHWRTITSKTIFYAASKFRLVEKSLLDEKKVSF